MRGLSATLSVTANPDSGHKLQVFFSFVSTVKCLNSNIRVFFGGILIAIYKLILDKSFLLRGYLEPPMTQMHTNENCKAVYLFVRFVVCF